MARWLLLALGLLFGWVLLTAGRIGTDLYRDSRFGSHRADRWFPWTYPLLSRWAHEHREFAFAALERQGYPYCLQALNGRLDGGWRPPEEWMSAQRWLQFGLLDDAVLIDTVDRLGRRPHSEVSDVLERMREQLNSSWWLHHHAQVFAMRLVRLAERRGEKEWLSHLPYELDAGTETCSRNAEGRLSSEVATIYARLDEILAGYTGDPLAGMTSQAGLLLDLLAENYSDPKCARALRKIFAAHWGDSMGLNAGCVLLRCHDHFAAAKYRRLANEDLRQLTRQQLHPSYLESVVIGLPDSRLARGCREYSAIRGADYFRDWPEPRFRWALTLLPQAIARASVEERGWRRWLARYPDHPGADDARWWLTRSLEWQGRRYEALELVAVQLTTPVGDSAYGRKNEFESEERITRAFEERFRWLLDVGTTTADLERFLRAHPGHPQVRYALAVRAARAHQYREALRLSEDLTIEVEPIEEWDEPCLATLSLENQRNRWRQLARHDLTTRWGRQAVLTSWLKNDGWRNGYLLLYNRGRQWGFAHHWYPSEADPSGRPDEKVIRQNYRDANPNFVALQLDPDSTEALYKQWTMYPVEESTYATGHGEEWFLRRAEQIAEKLTKARDPRGAVAWWHCYNIKNRTHHLEQVSEHYPKTADWARALLPPPEDGALQWWNRWF